VLASGRDVNILSSTPRFTPTPAASKSKATPLGASAKFAAAGKEMGRRRTWA
jgi:pyruvate-ferredoxin/flavodoxin oxidoreductase